MKKNLEILDWEDKKTQDNKRYVRIKTSEGWMSCFDKKEGDKLKELEGNIACVEIAESGNFKNIKKCYGSEDKDADEVEVEKHSPEKSNNKHTTMYVSYAKDMFETIYNPEDEATSMEMCMNEAIRLVRQAKEAFE